MGDKTHCLKTPFCRNFAHNYPGVMHLLRGNSQQVGAGQHTSLAERMRAFRAANKRLGVPGAAAHDQALPPTEAGRNLVEQGPCDNAGVFQAMGSAGCNILLCIMRTCDLPPFAHTAVADHTVSARGLRVASIISSLRVSNQNLRIQQTIAECLAPDWPENRCLPTADSRRELTRILADVTGLRELGWFADRCQEMARVIPTTYRRR